MKLKDILYESGQFSIGPVYHGGSWNGIKPIKVTGRGSLGIGAYFTPDRSKAQTYAAEAENGKVIAAYLNINNPLKIFMSGKDFSHPCVQALVLLGMDKDRAIKLVERIEEQKGYMGGEIKKLALEKGYDGIFQYFNGELKEIVVWNSMQVKVKEPEELKENYFMIKKFL
jgi:hypothetical protein